MQVYNLGPGCGKTETGIKVVRELTDKGSNVNYLSITNTAVDNARQRFTDANTDLTEEFIEANIKFSTMHSYALNLLRTHLSDKLDEIIPSDKPLQGFKLPPLRKLVRESQEQIDVHKHYIELKITKRTNKNDEEVRSLIMPLDYVLHLYYIYAVIPPFNDFLIIDEAQDFESEEIRVLTKPFNDNAVAFQDANQTVFQFRWTDQQSIPIKVTNDGATYTSYRLPKDSCEMLNRFLYLKREITGEDYTPLTFVESARETVEPSISFHELQKEVGDNGRLRKSYAMQSDLIREMQYLPEGKSLMILTMSNSEAVTYSTIVEKVLGVNSLATKYVALSSHPLYRAIRHYCRSDQYPPVQRNHNAESISRTVRTALRDAGFAPSEGRTVLKQLIDNPLDSAYDTNPLFPTVGEFTKCIRESIGATSMPRKMRFSTYHYTNKSESNAFITALSMLDKTGIRAARSGIRLDAEKPKTSHRVLTVHGAKGLEADITIADFSGFGLKNTDSMTIIQVLNMVYVALSRQKEKCYALIPSDQLNRSIISTDAMNAMAEYATMIQHDTLPTDPEGDPRAFAEVDKKSVLEGILTAVYFSATETSFKRKVRPAMMHIRSHVRKNSGITSLTP